MKLKYLNIAIIVITIIALFFEISRCGSPAGLVDGYPAWLADGEIYPLQTSGMAFIKNDEKSNPIFVIADDKGVLHLLKIKDKIFSITPILIDSSITDTLPDKVRLDFEDLAYDKYANKLFVSIEPYIKYPQQFGIFELEFKNNDIFSCQVTHLNRINITPDSLFTQYTQDNIGYEGLAVDSNYLYLGLEGKKRGARSFDGSLIRVVEKKNFTIIHTIFVDSLGINTITGLCKGDDGSLWGVDRNRLNFFNLQIDNKFKVTNIRVFQISNYVPNYHAFRYAAAIESIALDKKGFIYLIDDPYTDEFVPVDNILRKLDEKTIGRFKNLVPIIYKYKIN
jgi:hypothetical protein